MKRLRNILFFFNLLLFLLTTCGINYLDHYCSTADRHALFFFHDSECEHEAMHCEIGSFCHLNHKNAQESSHSMCACDTNEPVAENLSCCSNSHKYFAITDDFTLNKPLIKFKPIGLKIFTISASFIELYHNGITSTYDTTEPPPLIVTKKFIRIISSPRYVDDFPPAC